MARTTKAFAKAFTEGFNRGHKCGVWDVFEGLVSEYGEDIIDELLPVAEEFGLVEEDLKGIFDDDGAPEDWSNGERELKKMAGISEKEEEVKA